MRCQRPWELFLKQRSHPSCTSYHGVRLFGVIGMLELVDLFDAIDLALTNDAQQPRCLYRGGMGRDS